MNLYYNYASFDDGYLTYHYAVLCVSFRCLCVLRSFVLGRGAPSLSMCPFWDGCGSCSAIFWISDYADDVEIGEFLRWMRWYCSSTSLTGFAKNASLSLLDPSPKTFCTICWRNKLVCKDSMLNISCVILTSQQLQRLYTVLQWPVYKGIRLASLEVEKMKIDPKDENLDAHRGRPSLDTIDFYQRFLIKSIWKTVLLVSFSLAAPLPFSFLPF